MSVEKTVKLLWNYANTVEGDSHSIKLLKSHYMNTSRKLAKFNVQLPRDNFGVSKICQKCATQWHEGDFHLKLLPQRIANNAKTRKLITKLEDSKKSHVRGRLTTSQRKRAKWLKKRVVSKMQISCQFCQHKTLVPLEKSKKAKKQNATNTAEVKTESSLTKRKKNKNKNINAGLKVPLSMMQQIRPEKVAVKTKLAGISSKQVENKSKKNNQQKKPKIKQKSQSIVAPKVLSKTQQQNSLLQLASLLKSQATKAASSSAQNRLEALLK